MTWGSLATIGADLTGGKRIGREIVPSTLVWSRNTDYTVVIGPIWLANLWGAQMPRWSMHVACFGLEWGLNVGDVVPFNLA